MGRLQRKKHLIKAKKTSSKLTVSDAAAVLVASHKTLVSVKEKKQYLTPTKAVVVKRDGGFRKMFVFIKESRLELKKVIWPSRKQTIGSTFVVVLVVGLVSLFLGLADFGLSGILRMVLG